MRIALYAFATLTLLLAGTAFANEPCSYRWFSGSQGWCVDVDDSRLCIPFSVEVDSIGPSQVGFRMSGPDSSPKRLLFIHDGDSDFAMLAASDERVEQTGSFTTAGGVVNEHRTGDSNVRVFELTMKNDVIVVLFGFDADELLDVANVLAGSWEKV